MSFGEINGEKKCNMRCNNQLCHILSLAQIFSANIGNKTIICTDNAIYDEWA